MVTAGRGPVGGDAAQRAARAELAQREYHQDRPGWTTRILHWIGHKLGELFGAGGGSHTLLLVGVVLIGIAIVFAVRAGVPRRRLRSAAGNVADPLAPAAARDHRRLAAELTAAGRRAEAMREWLRAAIATIEERGVLPPLPGRTGAATAREAGPLLPSAADELAAATGAFDEVWFGGRAATDADVTHAHAAADAVLSARITVPAADNAMAAPR
jgi:hypothetical protein